MTPAQLARIRTVVAAKTQVHRELRRPLTLAGAKRVLEREGVTLSIRPHPRHGQLLRTPRGWKIVVDSRSSDAERLTWIAHELGHLWLHTDVDSDELVVFDRTEPGADTLREAEADHLAELLIARPVVRTRPKSRSKIYHTDQETTRQLRFLDDDPDEAMLRDVARSAARDDAKLAPVGHGHVQFALPRAAWNAISLAGAKVPLPHYTNIMTGPDFELVTATIETASVMVELLARAGYKRTAVYIRRTIREAADPYEVRDQHRTFMIREGAKHVAASSATWVTKVRKSG
jgi:hypothetical protein